MKRLYLTLLVLLLMASSSFAEGAIQKRVILGIYNSYDDAKKTDDNNRIYKNAAMVLNYLGMKVRYYDIQKGIPQDDMTDVAGFLIWFQDNNIPEPDKFLKWIINQAHKGKKIVILDYAGRYQDKNTKKEASEDVFNEFLGILNLKDEGLGSNNSSLIAIVDKDPHYVEFERTLNGEIENYSKITVNGSESKTYLKLKRLDINNSESNAILSTPQGGLALQGYVLFTDGITDNRRWRLNPFAFFEEAFGLKSLPRFDATTLFGRRIFYSHIDGDGFINVSEVKSQALSGEIIYDEILTKYELPITVSFIEAEVSPKYLGSEKSMALARKILALDNIEISAHGFTHPLNWEKQWTAYEAAGYTRKVTSLEDVDVAEARYSNVFVIERTPKEFLKREIDDVITFINDELAPKNKKVVIQQWTGNCKPPAEGIARTRSLKILNLNGGDTRMDRSRPTYTAVAPLVRLKDGQTQVLASSSNENLYTNLWLGPFYGFRYVIETFEQTQWPSLIDNYPRRVAPINIYYHFYSGEKIQSIKALKEVYDYVIKQDVIPIFTSDYALVVEGFHSGEVEKIKNDGWSFKNYGLDRTVRFDNQLQNPDLKRSKGILGFKRWEHSLYIHLDAAQALLYFQDQLPKEAYLLESSSLLADVHISKDTITFKTLGFGNEKFVFMNMLANQVFQVDVFLANNKTLNRKIEIKSSPDGVLIINLKIKENVQISVTRKT